MSHTAVSLLPATLDTSAAGPLRLALVDRIERGEPIVLNGSGVTRAGLACLQVLASARATADARGLAFRLDDCSDALAQMIALSHLDEALAVANAPRRADA